MALPADLVRVIVKLIPLRPRLLVIARVCRSWRAIAYASITVIAAPYKYAGPYDLYPNLTACAFDEMRGVPDSWTPVQCARISSAEFQVFDETAELSSISRLLLTSLTSLRLLCKAQRHGTVACATRLLARNALSLTYLTLVFDNSSSPAVGEVLPPMPALRSLEVHGCMGYVQHCCIGLVSQLTHLRATTIGMTSYPIIRPHQLPQMRDLSLRLASFDEAMDLTTALPSLTTLDVCISSWSSGKHLPALLQATNSKLIGFCLSARDPFETQAYRDALKCLTSLRHLALEHDCSLSFIESILPLGLHIRSINLTEPSSKKMQKISSTGYDMLAKYFTALTHLALFPADNLLNTEQLKVWWHLPYLQELTTSDRPLPWVTVALQTLTHLKSLHLSQITLGSNVTIAEVKTFEAEVRLADKRGMLLIHAKSMSLPNKNHKYAVHFDTVPLQRSLMWLTLAVGKLTNR